MSSPQPILHHANNSTGLSEHDYISKLIDAVAKRPVLYNVNLVDYKNKNKKGEGFKEVQNEMRETGANETQVQAIYKKWISIKRKFRVEYLRTKADQDNGRIPSTTYPYYESLKFLIPYCEFYKVDSRCSQAQKRRAPFFEGEDSEEERCIQEDDDFPTLTPQTTLDFLISQQKRIKLENQVNELAAAAVAMAAASSNNNNNTPTLNIESETNDENNQLFINSNNSTTSSSTSTTPTKRSSTSAASGSELIRKENNNNNGGGGCSNESTTSSSIDLPASSSPTISPNGNISSSSSSDESTNSLFGQLIARELDKLPTPMHNLMRAQILFLIAQTSHNVQMGNSNAERIMANFNCFN
uniref:MADF domain-containing protein n=1 Tax=Panagrolaimus sp. PS1159 TaxID=55785 RepID=A0AC35F9T4_9BILA